MYLIARSKYYQFEEYLGGWYERLKTDEPTVMTVRLLQEIEKYKVRSRAENTWWLQDDYENIVDCCRGTVLMYIIVCGVFGLLI